MCLKKKPSVFRAFEEKRLGVARGRQQRQVAEVSASESFIAGPATYWDAGCLPCINQITVLRFITTGVSSQLPPKATSSFLFNDY